MPRTHFSYVSAIAAVVLLHPLCAGNDEPEPAEIRAIFVGTPPDVVTRMLEVARIKKDDLVYDLGCGDGRIVIAAALRYGCRAVGYDIAPQKVNESIENVKRAGVDKLVRIELRDIFTVDLRAASVVTLYLLPEMNVQLIPQLEKMKSGSRIVAHDYGIEGVRHDELIKLTSGGVPREIYLYTVPLKKEQAREGKH